MAVFSGVTGTALFDVGVEKNVRRWRIEETAGAPTGGHSDAAGWTDAKPGRKAYTGSFEFFQDDGTIQPLRGGGVHLLNLTDGDGNQYNSDSGMNVVITSVSYDNDVEGGELVVGTVNFVGHQILIIVAA